MLAPPSTGKKKARARRVFGNAIIDEVENSLCYSLSEEEPYDTSSCRSSEASSNRDDSSSSHNSSSSSSSTFCTDKSVSTKETDKLQHKENQCKNNPSVSFMSPPASKKGTSLCSMDDDSNNALNETQCTQTSRDPFRKIIGTDKDDHVKDSPDRSRVQDKLRSMRRTTKSPFRRDLVKATQDAINKASISVNQSLQLGPMDLGVATTRARTRGPCSVNESLRAAQKSKEEALRYKSKQTARIRQEWKEDAADARNFNREAEKSRREILGLRRQLSSQMSKEKVERERNHRIQKLQKVEEELEFNSAAYREHQQKLRDEEDCRRRMSIEARAKLRENHRIGSQQLKLLRIEEENAILQERHEASVAARNHKKELAQNRRKSFAFRNGDARRIRNLFAQMEARKREEESKSFQLKWDGEKDVEYTKRRMEDARRESLAFRNAAAKKQREQEQERQAREQEAEHKSYEMKWDGERDAEAYRQQLEKERRDSLAFRNYNAQKQRQGKSEKESQAALAEHESYELKWAGEQDAEAYKARMAAEKRESLQGRNQMARKHRENEDTHRAAAAVQEHESYELKWAGERDAQQYRDEQEKERRDSLAFRNHQGKLQREQQAQHDADEQTSEHESYELKWGGERDAKAYKLLLASERRQSLASRNREGKRQRGQTESDEASRLAAEHASYELKWAGEKDAEKYKKELEKKRRESLALRNAEGVRHAVVMEELRTISREKETESLVLKWAGENDAKAYLSQLEKERRESLQLRGKQKVHERKIESQQREKEIQKAHEDEELRSADQKHIEGYKKQCANRDRTSFQFRLKEARVQRIQEDVRETKQKALDSKNFQLESEARTDVESYLEDCKRRRRLSLAFRAKEKRSHAQWRQAREEAERREVSLSVRHNLMDQRYVELARQKERARIALDSIRHASCSFNPFGATLY